MFGVALKLADLVPYENNARHNDKAVPVVAESIKQFGFKGAIVLNRESEGGTPEHPVIVNGHTRVKAMLSLGWTEIPDECIRYTDGLSEEEVKALRLADNRTGEVATWDKTKLQHEVANIKALDMSRFKFDFKSGKDGFIRGQERVRNNHGWNLDKCNIEDCAGDLQLPVMDPMDVCPSNMTAFNFAKSAKRFDTGIHFCIDDYQFERVWNTPEKYVELLRKFECVVTPDFSVYTDMPYPMKLWNIYRSLALGRYWQDQGLKVVPNVTWSDEASLSWIFEGYPKGGTIFISTLGVTKVNEYANECAKGFPQLEKVVHPSRILLLGDDLGYKFNCEVVQFKQRAWKSGKE